MYEDIRISLTVKRVKCEEMYDDLASLGPRLRAFRMYSIAFDHYRAKGSVPAAIHTDAHRPTTEDTSADDAILEAFGDELGHSLD